MKTHKLKIHSEYFKEVVAGTKTFEIRRNDRDYQVNDKVILQEFLPDLNEYSGERVEATITYITDYGQQDNFVVFSIKLND